MHIMVHNEPTKSMKKPNKTPHRRLIGAVLHVTDRGWTVPLREVDRFVMY